MQSKGFFESVWFLKKNVADPHPYQSAHYRCHPNLGERSGEPRTQPVFSGAYIDERSIDQQSYGAAKNRKSQCEFVASHSSE